VPGVFISYRREDSAGYAGRLYDVLSTEFGKENTYMDLDTIEGGDNFTAVIDEKIGVSEALVAVIGTRWLTVTGKDGTRRLDNPSDFVRHEIAKALVRGIRVIPVLVGGAIMPRPDELPEDLRALCERQAMEIRDSDFHPDAQQVTQVLRRDRHRAGIGPFKRRLHRFAPALVSAVGLIAIVAVFLLFHRPQPPTLPAVRPVNIAGKWSAVVKYDWGATYTNSFYFEVHGERISGMAGFAADKEAEGRSILDGKIAGNRISFTTKSLVTMGFDQPNAEERHYYDGTVNGATIRFTMTTDSTVSTHTPIHFTAHQLPAQP
jgi:hypothetical protein